MGLTLFKPRPWSLNKPKADTMAKLTEQDILNWDGPEEDYMNSDQLAFFRELLVKMQEELIENANTTTGHLQEHESAPDPADRSTDKVRGKTTE